MNLDYLHDPLPVPILQGESGDWKIRTFDLTKDEIMLDNLRAIRNGYPEFLVKPGTYTTLTCKGRGVIMSNTPMEVKTNLPFIKAAQGKVLINGLGLGMVLRAVLDKPEVKSVTVYEIDSDVIALVSPGFVGDITSGRLIVKQANCFDYKPVKGEVYDVAWHDVWDTICADNLPQMDKLTRKWSRRIPVQLCWAKSLCQRY